MDINQVGIMMSNNHEIDRTHRIAGRSYSVKVLNHDGEVRELELE